MGAPGVSPSIGAAVDRSAGTRVGLICLPGLEPAVVAGRTHLEWIEIEPQVSWVPELGVDSVLRSGPALVARECGLPVLLHSVSAPLGGTVRPPPAQVELLAELTAEFQCPWVSEHLSFLRVPGDAGGTFTGALLAPPQTDAAVEVAAANIDHLRRGVGVPVAFETGVNYLRPRAGEMSDGAFFRAVAEAGGGGILLDLHNLWCNEQNGRQPAREVIAELPLDRIWEIHIAAGYRRDGYYLDAHSGLADGPVLDLLAEVVPTLPNLGAVIFEVSPDRLGHDGLTIGSVVDHLDLLTSIVDVPGLPLEPQHTRPTVDLLATPTGTASAVRSPELVRWERDLGGLVLGQEPSGDPAGSLADDRGHLVWQEIAQAARRGQLAGALPLTTQLLVRAVGKAAVLDALEELWAQLPPAETCAAEIGRLVPHLRATWSASVRSLDRILDLELAAHRQAMDALRLRTA